MSFGQIHRRCGSRVTCQLQIQNPSHTCMEKQFQGDRFDNTGSPTDLSESFVCVFSFFWACAFAPVRLAQVQVETRWACQISIQTFKCVKEEDAPPAHEREQITEWIAFMGNRKGKICHFVPLFTSFPSEPAVLRKVCVGFFDMIPCGDGWDFFFLALLGHTCSN